MNGEVENAVTWDTDNLVEDFWFGIQVGLRLLFSGETDELGFREGVSCWMASFVCA